MRLLRKWALAALGAGAALAYSGFPRRVGVTRSQADLSLPGDLLLPTADVQADRAHEFRASPAELWPAVLAVEDLYAYLWDRPLTVVAEEPGELLILATPSHLDDWHATLTAALLPSTDGRTVVHLRERYQGKRPLTVTTALAAPLTWIRISRSLA